MKRVFIFSILAVSLAANALLLRRHLGRERAASAAPATAPAPATPPAPAKAAPLAWDAGLAAQIATARAAGLPAAVIRTWATAEVDTHFAAREKALRPPPRQHYWQAVPRGSVADQLALADLAWEKSQLLDRLLGYDPDRPENAPYRFLPREKQEAVKRIAEPYAARLDVLRTALGRMSTAAETAELARVHEECRQALSQLLTADEQKHLDLRWAVARWSPLPPDAMGVVRGDVNRPQPPVSALRNKLRYFDVTEQEFMAIHAIEQEFEASRRSMDTQVLNQQIADKTRALLGPERFADLENKSSPHYLTIAEVVGRLGLPPATAAQIAASRQRADAESARIDADPSLDIAGKKEALKAFVAAERAALVAAVGQDGATTLAPTVNRWLDQMDQGRIVRITSSTGMSMRPVEQPAFNRALLPVPPPR